MFYIEVGAHDGVFQSQTIRLERNGWNGLLIEANPVLFEACKRNRNDKTNIFENVCLMGKDYKEDTVTFYSYDNLGAMGRTKDFFVNESIKGTSFTVKAVQLNDILRKHNINKVHFFSVDTEGAELDILGSIDFNSFMFKEILVEIHGKTATPDREFVIIDEMLKPYGFITTSIVGTQFHAKCINTNWGE